MPRLKIHNFKSIDDLELELGRVTLLIGENGCGKTSILEALGMAAAAANFNLSNGALKDRGIRVTEPSWMRSAFEEGMGSDPVRISFHAGQAAYGAELTHDNTAYGVWRNKTMGEPSSLIDLNIEGYLAYAPREDVLRDVARDSDVEPIGIHGEGLFKLLQVLDAEGQLGAVKEQLALLGWFDDLSVAAGVNPSSRSLQIRDIFLDGKAPFDQRSANEGFLFVLLYACLLVSSHTPKFFAIDNVDTALNPKLCAGTLRMFTALAKRHDKRVLLTAHNPGALDGLNLHDDEQRLLVVYRNTEGRTRTRRITASEGSGQGEPLRLSEAFLRGYLGALPTNF